MAKIKKAGTKPGDTTTGLGTVGGAATGAAAGAAAGAAVGSLLGPLGAAVGAVVGGVAGGEDRRSGAKDGEAAAAGGQRRKSPGLRRSGNRRPELRRSVRPQRRSPRRSGEAARRRRLWPRRRPRSGKSDLRHSGLPLPNPSGSARVVPGHVHQLDAPPKPDAGGPGVIPARRRFGLHGPSRAPVHSPRIPHGGKDLIGGRKALALPGDLPAVHGDGELALRPVHHLHLDAGLPASAHPPHGRRAR